VRDLDALVEHLRKIPTVKGMTVLFFYPYDQDERPLPFLFTSVKLLWKK